MTRGVSNLRPPVLSGSKILQPIKVLGLSMFKPFKPNDFSFEAAISSTLMKSEPALQCHEFGSL
jgi:hypothetical protein